MKYYLVTFSDYSETIGKNENITKMRADANRYCKMWNLSETVREIIEISENEYNARLRK